MCYRSNAMRVQSVVRNIGLVAACLLMCEPVAAEPPKPLAVLKGHTDDVSCLAFSPDGKTAASASTDDTIRLWDVVTGKEQVVLKTGRLWPRAIAFSPDGKVLATGGGSGLHLWNLGTRKRMTADQDGSADVRISVAFSANGKTVAYSGWCDGRLELWDAATGKLTMAFKKGGNPGSGPVAIAFTPDGRELVSCGRDDGVEVWDVATGKHKAGAKTGKATYPVALTPDGKLLAAIEDFESDEGKSKLRLLVAATGKELVQFDVPGFSGFLFSRDGKTLAAGNGWIYVWDAGTGKERMQLRPGDFAELLAISPDGTVLATRDEHNVIKLWNVPPLK